MDLRLRGGQKEGKWQSEYGNVDLWCGCGCGSGVEEWCTGLLRTWSRKIGIK